MNLIEGVVGMDEGGGGVVDRVVEEGVGVVGVVDGLLELYYGG